MRMLFGRKRESSSARPNSPGPSPADERTESGLELPALAPTRFDVEASFSIVGLGEVLGGTVISGTVRVGETYRLHRPPSSSPALFGVLVHRIVWRERPNPRVILYRGQYLHRLEFAGPGQRVSIGVRGVPKGAILKGDYLST